MSAPTRSKPTKIASVQRWAGGRVGWPKIAKAAARTKNPGTSVLMGPNLSTRQPDPAVPTKSTEVVEGEYQRAYRNGHSAFTRQRRL
jgi:hypothetical protein